MIVHYVFILSSSCLCHMFGEIVKAFSGKVVELVFPVQGCLQRSCCGVCRTLCFHVRLLSVLDRLVFLELIWKQTENEWIQRNACILLPESKRMTAKCVRGEQVTLPWNGHVAIIWKKWTCDPCLKDLKRVALVWNKGTCDPCLKEIEMLPLFERSEWVVYAWVFSARTCAMCQVQDENHQH